MREILAEFGNLICRFGDGVLVDLLEEVVLPALLDERLVRNYKETQYFFHGVEVVDLTLSNGEKVAGVAGRLIKNTNLVREQVYDEERGLVRDTRSLKSSPSSFFVLVLNNHRLIYARETADAPTMQTFRSTLHSFIRRKHSDHVNNLYEEHLHLAGRGKVDGLSRKDFEKRYPVPTLELVPLTASEEISSFIDRFSVLRTIEIVAKERNHELDNKAFFAKMQGMQEDVGSSVTTLRHSSSTGLDLEAAVEQITDATEQGNHLVKLAGLDLEGDKLRGNNEEFQLKRQIEPLGKVVQEGAKRLFKNFASLVELGVIKLPPTPKQAAEAVLELLSRTRK